MKTYLFVWVLGGYCLDISGLDWFGYEPVEFALLFALGNDLLVLQGGTQKQRWFLLDKKEV